MGLFDVFKKKGLNPLRGCMNLGCYSVSGVNPATGRKKSVKVAAASEAEAVSRSGLADAAASEVGWPAPSEAQLAYAKKRGLQLQSGLVADDVSAMLTRAEDGEAAAVPAALVDAAAREGIAMSYYVGRGEYEYRLQKGREARNG